MKQESLKLKSAEWQEEKVHLRIVAVGVSGPSFDLIHQLEKFLHPAEYNSYQKPHFSERRLQYLLGRVAAKFSLYPNLQKKHFSETAILPGADQKPYCHIDQESFGVSITHSRQMSFGMSFPSQSHFSLDFEVSRPELAAIRPTIMNEKERYLLSSFPCTTKGLTETILWCVKEAAGKLKGIRRLEEVINFRVDHFSAVPEGFIFSIEGHPHLEVFLDFADPLVLSVARQGQFSKRSRLAISQLIQSVHSWEDQWI